MKLYSIKDTQLTSCKLFINYYKGACHSVHHNSPFLWLIIILSLVTKLSVFHCYTIKAELQEIWLPDKMCIHVKLQIVIVFLSLRVKYFVSLCTISCDQIVSFILLYHKNRIGGDMAPRQSVYK